ncbi:hypothetical protein [Allorhodopirellula heiligendammensis]|uniref:Secreted protein n=1 Tax=Allorhodopirellula heiligendammensis TaxID=2714739 RepID=A0A5C6C469_9BACT|nr:hypothetical protein [Allorhodopirellula heiligendammensis]TWU18316.1 hypothetical protein Poly21_04780 [Allorhodopirellula heiligendammensis]|tara:strand:- start:9 stop:179 length:171 start_codon:yes stop_codon:yes gene_type:complete
MRSLQVKYKMCLLLVVMGCSMQCGCGGPPPPPPIDAAMEAESQKHDEEVREQESGM